MSRFLLVLCFAAFGTALPSSRILGGFKVDIKDAPYQVALLLDWKKIGEYVPVCGGSIIRNDVILTSAQCPEHTKAYQWQIRAGSSSSTSDGQVVDVAEIVVHPSYNEEMDYDIALYFLEEPLTFSTKVLPITLPNQDEPVPEKGNGLVTGWGATKENGYAEALLHKISMPLMDQNQCIKIYGAFNPITSRMFCAGDKNVSPCYGDFGGPLVIEDKVVGVTSWGLGCVMPGYPGVWTKVSLFVDWIEAEIEEREIEEK